MKKILPVITISFLAGAFTSLSTTYITSNYVLDKMNSISLSKNISLKSDDKIEGVKLIKDQVINDNKDTKNEEKTKENLVDNKENDIININEEKKSNDFKEDVKNNDSIIEKDTQNHIDEDNNLIIEKNKSIENESDNEIINNLPESERENATKVADEVKASAEQNYKKEAFSLIANKVKSFAVPYMSYDSNPKADIIIFASYKCPYCHKLFNELDRIRYKGYNVYVLPIPKNGLNSEEEDNLINFECLDSKQKPEAFVNMFNGVMPKKYEGKNLNSCKLNIERFYDLAIKMGADGTPFSFTNEGNYTMSYKDIDSFLLNLNLK